MFNIIDHIYSFHDLNYLYFCAVRIYFKPFERLQAIQLDAIRSQSTLIDLKIRLLKNVLKYQQFFLFFIILIFFKEIFKYYQLKLFNDTILLSGERSTIQKSNVFPFEIAIRHNIAIFIACNYIRNCLRRIFDQASIVVWSSTLLSIKYIASRIFHFAFL